MEKVLSSLVKAAQDRARPWVRAYAGKALLLGAPLLLLGCRKDQEGDCFKSSGPVTTERRELAAFHVLRLYDNVEVTVVQDTETYAKVRTGRNLQEDLKLNVQDGTLTISNTSRCNWVRRYDVPRQVTLHVPRLTDVFHVGEKTMRTEGTFLQDTLFLHLSRAGDLEFNVECKYLWVDLYELGDMKLSGQSDELIATVGDLGRLFAKDLTTKRASVHLDKLSDGDAHVRTLDFLGATVAGTGTLYYSGPPAQKDVKVTGKGKAAAVQ
ncbi:head GIN domain-containing protein [Hymenobacter oligotrophus]|uniref:head GIN domain-containing protein n=1 Tax=Hymenobacter oligotrophus TaxID=2319843 RepID=UPI0019691926|nr:head GIN domain-containing protein [Hymenobacter oligotrophus]